MTQTQPSVRQRGRPLGLVSSKKASPTSADRGSAALSLARHTITIMPFVEVRFRACLPWRHRQADLSGRFRRQQLRRELSRSVTHPVLDSSQAGLSPSRGWSQTSLAVSPPKSIRTAPASFVGDTSMVRLRVQSLVAHGAGGTVRQTPGMRDQDGCGSSGPQAVAPARPEPGRSRGDYGPGSSGRGCQTPQDRRHPAPR